MKPILISRFVLAAATLLGIGQALWYAPQLPATTATHFTLDGHPNGYSSGTAFTLIQILLILSMALLFGGMGWLLRNLPTALLNLPNREYWLADERREATMAYIQNQMAWFGTATVGLLVLVFGQVSRANLAHSVVLPASYPALIGFVLFTLIWTIFYLRRFRKPR